jgi:hypothetical protein
VLINNQKQLKMTNKLWNGCWYADYELIYPLLGASVSKTIKIDVLINPNEKPTFEEVKSFIKNINGMENIMVVRIYYK